MKRRSVIFAMLLPLLCGCSVRNENTDVPSETIVPSAAASQAVVDKPAEKLSERCMEEFTFEGGSSGSSFNLVLTDRETGEKTYVGYTIWYANPENEGGPVCFCVSGASGGTICYVEAEDMQTETYLRDTFNALVLEGIRREENIVHRAE